MYKKIGRARRLVPRAAAVVALLIVIAPPVGATDVAKGRQLALQDAAGVTRSPDQRPDGLTHRRSLRHPDDPTTTATSLMFVVQLPHPKMTYRAMRNLTDAVNLTAFIL